MTKILGLDLGTNSIGWAIVEKETGDYYHLLDKGVHIFQDGVAHDKSGEKPAVQDRTAARASRRHYFRRRIRKIDLLKVLISYELCPPVLPDELELWRKKKIYPTDEDFLTWQRTDENSEKNPYHDRFVCLTQKLDLKLKADRYVLGRALYHLNQRRGFLSNRKDASNDDENGKVKSDITSLSKEMTAAGCSYLGEYFYHCYGKEKIRTRYTARNEHYRAEFDAICQKQQLPETLIKALERVIFYQRPLKSQKGNVGHCTFEKGKPRCAVSHPRYEEFRMWQFLNSVRVSYLEGGERPLSQEEVALIFPLFFRKSKPDFDFEELAKKLAGKGNYSYRDDSKEVAYKFNYKMTANVPGCPVMAAMLDTIGITPSVDWDKDLCAIYTKGEGKTTDQIINDVWHALFSFDDENKLIEWLISALQMDEDNARKLANARIPMGYASLSLKAINKILPWLKKGYLYSHAVFFANLDSVLPGNLTMTRRQEIEENIQIILDNYASHPFGQEKSLNADIKGYLLGAVPDAFPDKLYHPSMIDIYPHAMPDKDGRIRLGSPRTDAFKNPMAMRALFRLRALINQLMDEGAIDPQTKIHIEFARGLNDANRRKAIEDYQRELANQRKDDGKKIAAEYEREFGKEIEPTEDDLLKYRMWEEQDHKCIYTGKQIPLSGFLGSATEFDIEHTIPRSRGGDDSLMNKTLCDAHFNRFDKKAKIPFELEGHDVFLQRITKWKEQVGALEERISYQKRRSRNAATKTDKDNAIRQMHLLTMKRDYWKGKYERFTMKTVPDGFSNRQGVDIGIIGKYARLYLQTVFKKTYVVKGATTAAFRREWGLQKEYAKKERNNHAHHCIDAVTIACIGKEEYDQWKLFVEQYDNYWFGKGEKPLFEKPWPTFTEDVLSIPEELIVSHYTPDNMPKKSRKKLRVRGVIQRNEAGEPLYCQGDSARGLLHKDTFYGAIKRDDEIKYVVRKALDSIDEKDIKNIVDDVVREKIQSAVLKFGNIKKAVENGIWMNYEKHIPINKVRVYVAKQLSPIPLANKKQRDKSLFNYKQPYYVVNSQNYGVALYGIDKPSFEIVSYLHAATFYNNKQEYSIVPYSNDFDIPLRCFIKVGTALLLYEKSPRELRDCNQSELVRRLYKVVGIALERPRYCVFTMLHHQQPSQDVPFSKSEWHAVDDVREKIVIRNTQFKALVEGYDFDLTITGRISFKDHSLW
jgi:CRISPR-associated endonuclease Csn1